MLVEVSLGEALDKLSILEIKKEKITDHSKLSEIQKEFNYLYPLLEPYLCNELYLMLKQINLDIWKFCDDIRIPNLNSKEYIQNCIDIINYNDARFKIKNKINLLFDSSLKEQKSYQPKVISYNVTDINEHVIQEIKRLSLFNDIITISNSNHIDVTPLKIFFQSDKSIKFD